MITTCLNITCAFNDGVFSLNLGFIKNRVISLHAYSCPSCAGIATSCSQLSSNQPVDGSADVNEHVSTKMEVVHDMRQCFGGMCPDLGPKNIPK